MGEKEIFQKVILNVSNISGIDTDMILHCNREECVDARYVLVSVLSIILSDRQISVVSGLSVPLVNKARNTFNDRCRVRWGLKQMFDEVLAYSGI